MNPFKGRHFQRDIILWAVRWYCKYGISYRELQEMLAERGVNVDHSTIYRWVQRYAPEMEKRLRWYWRNPSDLCPWHMDETYVKVNGRWAYLYRAVDSRGRTVDFYLSSRRNSKAAYRFLGKILNNVKKWQIPRFINTDKAPAYGRALALLKREGRCPSDVEHRQIKYRNNVIECDHGKLKRIIGATLGFKSMKTAYAEPHADLPPRTPRGGFFSPRSSIAASDDAETTRPRTSSCSIAIADDGTRSPAVATDLELASPHPTMRAGVDHRQV
ncbi:IS6 family transposase [Enterobacter hormaechei]|uniref:IS6 family transposase n=2 Tax=Enterobacteriaceae TaxID=543 RepID=UPI0027D2F3E9|nr:IS6 family transposase [Enterobacter hormaechei]WMA23776.1 IS6 family transposase [Enterobacter hormaechei]